MIGIQQPTDWAVLRKQGLLTVLDPLTFRAAEALLRGAPADGDEPVWDAISQSLAAVGTFIDAVMLNDRLPIFDYSVSWEPELGGRAGPFVDLCNEDEELLVEVTVEGLAYHSARQQAVEILRRLPEVRPRLAADIRGELSAFDYRWRPQLAELGDLDEDARTLASFRYGGLLFHRYAESISDRRQPLDRRAEHVVHAKRAQVIVASSLAPGGELQVDERRLMARLRSVERHTDGAVRALDLQAPSFLPFLLAKQPRSARDLLRIALRERRTGPVRSYRDWRSQVRADLADGRVRAKTRRDLDVIARDIQRHTTSAAATSLHLSYTADWTTLLAVLTGNPAALLTGIKIEANTDLRALASRLQTVLPGRGYRKLICGLVASQDEYFAIDRALRNLWYRTAA